MATSYPLKVNGVTIKTPSSFKISTYNLTKAGRVASGKMTMELVAKKKKFFLKYDVLHAKDLHNILSIIDSNELFFTFTYYDELEVARSVTCYVGEIPTTLFYRPTVGDGSMWKEIEFNFIEQ